MSKIALLIVDVQNALLDAHPYNEQRVIKSIQTLILAAREYKVEVLYVRTMMLPVKAPSIMIIVLLFLKKRIQRLIMNYCLGSKYTNSLTIC